MTAASVSLVATIKLSKLVHCRCRGQVGHYNNFIHLLQYCLVQGERPRGEQSVCRGGITLRRTKVYHNIIALELYSLTRNSSAKRKVKSGLNCPINYIL